MSSNLGNGYIGADVNFINDATQEALDLKSNLAGGNTFTGDQNLSNGNIVLANGSKLQGNEIVGNNELYMRTLGDANIRLEPAGTGTITATKDINLSAGKQYLINGVASVGISPAQATAISQNTSNITTLSNDKANKAGGNNFTGNQQLTSANYDIVTSGEYRKDGVNILDPYRTSAASDILLNDKAGITSSNIFNGVYNRFNTNVLVEQTHFIQTAKIAGFSGLNIQTDNNEDIALDPHGTGEVTSTKDIDLATGKAYKVNGTDILSPYRTSAATDTLLNAKANDSVVVKTSGDQTIGGVKTFNDDVILKDDLKMRSDNCSILFGQSDDINITHIHDVGLSTNGTFSATKYNVNGVQITSSDLSNDAKLVKTDTTQTISDVKTFGVNTIFNGDIHINTDIGKIKIGNSLDREIGRTASGISTNATMDATQYNINGTNILSPYRTSAATDTLLDAKANLTANTFTERQTITKAHNYSQLNLIDSSTAGIGKGGGIEFLGVFNGSGATTSFATIKSQKANATLGNYEANLSLQVREHGGGGYTEVIGLKGGDLSAHFSGAVNINGGLNLTLAGIPEGTGATKETEPTGLSVGDVWRAGTASSQTLKIKSS